VGIQQSLDGYAHTRHGVPAKQGMSSSFQKLQQQLEAAEAEVAALREEAAQRLQQLADAHRETADVKQEVHHSAHCCHACCLAGGVHHTSTSRLSQL
jgi:Skp family chaperone for outer membrane proteins